MKITFRYHDIFAKDYKTIVLNGVFDNNNQTVNLNMTKEFLSDIAELSSRFGIECDLDMELDKLDVNPEITGDAPVEPIKNDYMVQSFDLANDIQCHESLDENSIFYVESIQKTETHNVITINESTFKFFLEDTPFITFGYKLGETIQRINAKIIEDIGKTNQFHISKSNFLILSENNK